MIFPPILSSLYSKEDKGLKIDPADFSPTYFNQSYMLKEQCDILLYEVLLWTYTGFAFLQSSVTELPLFNMLSSLHNLFTNCTEIEIILENTLA